MLLRYASSSVADARHRFAADLRLRRIQEPAVGDAVLVLSELVSNAIRHARPLSSGKIVVTWDIADNVVWIAVTDGGSDSRPVSVRPPVSALGGRGLNIVSMLAREWGVEDGARGTTTVWAQVGLRDTWPERYWSANA